MDILIVVVLTSLNGVFSMAEIAVVSARKARLQQWADEGNSAARTALELANAPNRFLPTVQIGMTLIGILTGAFGGATVAHELALLFQQIPPLAPYSEALGFGLVVAFITYLSLVIGELVPKRLGLRNPERIAVALAPMMRWLAVGMSPAVRLLSWSSEGVVRLLGIQGAEGLPVTEQEIRLLIEQGTEAGVFHPTEQDMVEGVFRLDDVRVPAIMTPRIEIIGLDMDAPPDENRRKIIEGDHSRYPVYRETADKVLGMVHTKDLLNVGFSGQDLTAALKIALKTPLFVPETTRASTILEQFKTTGIHEALVIDEFGGIHGLVTMTDILQVIVGELDTPQALQRDDGSWLLDGLMPIDEFKDLFDLRELLDKAKANYRTLAGFILFHEGRIPAAADHFEWGGLYFEVLDMDGKRIDKVLVKRLPSAE